MNFDTFVNRLMINLGATRVEDPSTPFFILKVHGLNIRLQFTHSEPRKILVFIPLVSQDKNVPPNPNLIPLKIAKPFESYLVRFKDPQDPNKFQLTLVAFIAFEEQTASNNLKLLANEAQDILNAIKHA